MLQRRSRKSRRTRWPWVIRAETASGTRRDGRTELRTLLDFVQPGDTLVVTRIDRLARSMKDLQDIVHELKGKGVALRATEQPVDTSTAAGKAFLDMLGVFAEFETNLRRGPRRKTCTRRTHVPHPRTAACHKGGWSIPGRCASWPPWSGSASNSAPASGAECSRRCAATPAPGRKL